MEGAGGENGTLRGHARIGDSGSRFGWLLEAYSLETDGFKELASGDPTGFDVADFMGKIRVNSDRSGPWYQELELRLGYTDEESAATYLGLTDADFAVNPLQRYPASGSDLMKAEHSQIQLRHFWVRGAVDVTTTAYRNDFARNWYKLQSVLGTGISNVLDAPDQNASAFAVLRGEASDPDALRVRANNRDYFAQGVQSTLGLGLGDHALELGVRIHRDQEDRLQWEDAFQMQSGDMVLTTPGDPGSQSNRVSSADALAFFLQDEIELGRLVVSPGIRFEHIDFTRTDYAKDDPARTEPTGVRENRVDAWIPGVGFSYRAAAALNLFWGVHKGFGPQGPGAGEATRPESSVNYEFGGRWRNSGLAAQASVFYSDYTNILGRATLATAERTAPGRRTTAERPL
jgi:Fe(3+) dicitrate transport protein